MNGDKIGDGDKKFYRKKILYKKFYRLSHKPFYVGNANFYEGIKFNKE